MLVSHACQPWAFLEQQRQLWNVGLDQLKTAYQRQDASLTAYDQCKDSRPCTKTMTSGSTRWLSTSALNRLHKAFQSFFVRLKAGKKPGFPRFKGRGRVRSSSIRTRL